MTASPETLENLLESDLDRIFGELADDESSTELYRALTNNRWSNNDGPDGHVALSWGRAGQIFPARRPGRITATRRGLIDRAANGRTR